MSAPSANLLTSGVAEALHPQPCTLVIFGGSGDLSHRKLLPAIYNLAVDGVLPTNFAVVGFAIDDMDDVKFRAFAREGIQKFSRQELVEQHWSDYEKTLFYVRGSFKEAEAFARLRQRLEEIEPQLGVPGNRVFYMSIPPSLIETCATQLQAAGLVRPAAELPFSRIIVEKPIGRDLGSARAINDTLARAFDESQIYRIDHYLGKETVQNVMVMRFGNAIFEPLWSNNYVDHVQITVAEEEGVGTRARYYEEAGALRDMVQNHMLQLLCTIAMEPPWSNHPEVVRDYKLAVLRCLRPMTEKDVDQYVVRAQYGAGFEHGVDVPGYRREEGVKSDSITETYVAMKMFVDNWRWSGVPFYLRTGKRLPKRASEIAVQFKDVPGVLFNTRREAPLEPNVLALRIQPDEGISLRICAKLPGPKARVYPVKMDFRYLSTFGEQSPEAYERLLLDVMAGDATLFMRRDAVEASWKWCMHILDRWKASGSRWLPEYPAGTWGPLEADKIVHADNRKWRTL
jgi:glucose-6-phosphate 1-dehydrogenase